MKDYKNGNNRFDRGSRPPVFSRPSFKGGDKRFGGKPFSKNGETHSATCSKCNSACEVPFIPNGKKPVFCQNCYVRDDSRDTRPTFEKRSFGPERAPMPSRSAEDPRVSTMLKEIGAMHAKLDALIKRIDGAAAAALTEAEEAPVKKAAKKIAKKKA